MMEELTVESSQIESLKYEESGERVTVTFKKGATWTYAPVSAALWSRWKVSDSVGSFFMRVIKDNPDITATEVRKRG